MTMLLLALASAGLLPDGYPPAARTDAPLTAVQKVTAGLARLEAATAVITTRRLEELVTKLRGESRSETTRKEAAEMLRAADNLRA